MAKEKLTGLNRAFIPGMLPVKGGRLEQIVVREILEIIEFKSSEFKEFGLTQHANGSLTWEPKPKEDGAVWKIMIEKEFDLKKPHTQLLKDSVIRLDKEKGIDQRNLDTCLRIEKMRG